jgi:hypothetical protein
MLIEDAAALPLRDEGRDDDALLDPLCNGVSGNASSLVTAGEGMVRLGELVECY